MTELERARELGRAALQTLEANRRRIDDLNVYPVPDGDTGTNLTETARAIMDVLEVSTAADRAVLAKELTRAALMGARGNSGVIFSQILRGAAEALGEAGLLDAATIRRAFRAASDAAYRAVRRPVEGTMLSVIRELAEEAEDPRNADLEPAALLKKLIERGEDALARTPDQLAVLERPGSSTPAARACWKSFAASQRRCPARPLPDAPAEDAHEAGIDAVHQELSEYRYCTVFVIEGEDLDAEALEAEFEQLGDSLLVVGDSSALKVHVHTDEPGKALALGTAVGTIEGVEIANMHKQAAERTERILEAVPDRRVDAGDRGRRRRPGGGEPPSLRELRRHARDRRRPDDEPVDGGHRRRDRVDPGRPRCWCSRTTRTSSSPPSRRRSSPTSPSE